MGGHMRKNQWGGRKRGNWVKSSLWFLQEGTYRLKFASLNHFRIFKTQELSLVVWHFAQGWLQQVSGGPSVKEVIGLWTLDWLVCVWKVLLRWALYISRNWLNLGEALAPGSARPHVSKHMNVRASEYNAEITQNLVNVNSIVYH